MWHVGFQFPDQGLNPWPLPVGVLITGPPGKSQENTSYYRIHHPLVILTQKYTLGCIAVGI